MAGELPFVGIRIAIASYVDYFKACRLILKTLLFLYILICVALLTAKLYIVIKKLISKNRKKELIVGFFHPYCNAGGGKERVLWSAVRGIQKQYKDAHCVVYSGDYVPATDIIRNVEVRFNIKLLRNIDIIYLRTRFLVEAKYYPLCTLLMQNLGSMVLGLEAILKYVPDIYIDTMGYAWTYPVTKFFGSCPLAAYVHYPTISTDMLKNIQTRTTTVNNREFISQSEILSMCKLIYYQIFASFYNFVGRYVDVIMVNSSWTRNHILELWKNPQFTFIVYPPCDVSEFNRIPLEIHDGKTRIMSIAHFRPEKNHELQIRAFHNFLQRLNNQMNPPILVLIGSCMHEKDYRWAQKLKYLCSELAISDKVEFKINLTFQEIIQEMKNSVIGLHTMRDEQFGIGIVECMSAGLIMIAHNSGGPKMDIIVNYNGKISGFLADDINTFADAMEYVWKLEQNDLYVIRANARDSVSRFSTDRFENDFLSVLQLLFM